MRQPEFEALDTLEAPIRERSKEGYASGRSLCDGSGRRFFFAALRETKKPHFDEINDIPFGFLLRWHPACAMIVMMSEGCHFVSRLVPEMAIVYRLSQVQERWRILAIPAGQGSISGDGKQILSIAREPVMPWRRVGGAEAETTSWPQRVIWKRGRNLASIYLLQLSKLCCSFRILLRERLLWSRSGWGFRESEDGSEKPSGRVMCRGDKWAQHKILGPCPWACSLRISHTRRGHISENPSMTMSPMHTVHTSTRRRCACPQRPETRATWALKIVERPSRVAGAGAGAGAGQGQVQGQGQGKAQGKTDHSTQGKGKLQDDASQGKERARPLKSLGSAVAGVQKNGPFNHLCQALLVLLVLLLPFLSSTSAFDPSSQFAAYEVTNVFTPTTPHHATPPHPPKQRLLPLVCAKAF
ncbi:hypothetical protein F5882DRAFT_376568 [Hyaloscypha sp. PMI_1271]|nr:hypothetical protein F5882DRAFT_376568 [Hyaloscypha sp. PMI_1271]